MRPPQPHLSWRLLLPLALALVLASSFQPTTAPLLFLGGRFGARIRAAGHTRRGRGGLVWASANPQDGGLLGGARAPPPEAPWFVEGAKFGCTGCGKCCRVKGDVWLSPTEAEAAAAFLDLTVPELAEMYGEDWLQQGWLRLRSRKFPEGGEACIFLDDANQCTIYEARPLQCRTYPWWPRIMQSREAWLNESVVPDDVPLGPHWNEIDGGCEGIEHPEAPVVEFSVIRQNLLTQMGYNRALPTNLKA